MTVRPLRRSTLSTEPCTTNATSLLQKPKARRNRQLKLHSNQLIYRNYLLSRDRKFRVFYCLPACAARHACLTASAGRLVTVRIFVLPMMVPAYLCTAFILS